MNKYINNKKVGRSISKVCALLTPDYCICTHLSWRNILGSKYL